MKKCRALLCKKYLKIWEIFRNDKEKFRDCGMLKKFDYSCTTLVGFVCNLENQKRTRYVATHIKQKVHVVNIYLMQSPNQNLPLSKEEGIWKRKIGV
jgi:hypothetical protein